MIFQDGELFSIIISPDILNYPSLHNSVSGMTSLLDHPPSPTVIAAPFNCFFCVMSSHLGDVRLTNMRDLGSLVTIANWKIPLLLVPFLLPLRSQIIPHVRACIALKKKRKACSSGYLKDFVFDEM